MTYLVLDTKGFLREKFELSEAIPENPVRWSFDSSCRNYVKIRPIIEGDFADITTGLNEYQEGLIEKLELLYTSKAETILGEPWKHHGKSSNVKRRVLDALAKQPANRIALEKAVDIYFAEKDRADTLAKSLSSTHPQ